MLGEFWLLGLMCEWSCGLGHLFNNVKLNLPPGETPLYFIPVLRSRAVVFRPVGHQFQRWSFSIYRFGNSYFRTPASQVAPLVKNPPANAGDIRDLGSIPGLGGSPGRWHGNLLQYSCLENPLDRGAWQPAVHRAAKRHAWSNLACMPAL